MLCCIVHVAYDNMAGLDSSVYGKSLAKDEEKSGKAKRKERKLKNEPSSVIFDSVPDTLNVMDFFAAHAKEFSSMMNALKKKGGSKRTFQRLPRHMRRRATSHNVKRLPRRLQEQAINEVNQMGSKSDRVKRETRRKKRRPSNLKKEYERRQGDKKWLETHLWHAKRMRMVNKWGYRIALHCNDKGIRANYRFIKHGAIISDISYYSCIQLHGSENDVVKFLTPMFPTGLLPSLFGETEVEAMMYKPHLYPYHCIGPVYLLWQPDLTQTRTVWLWVHPSIHKQVLDIIETELTTLIIEDSSPVVKVTNLRDDLVRFRLIGPQALAVLLSVLHLKKLPLRHSNEHNTVNSEGEKYLRASSKWDDISSTSQKRKWWLEAGAIPTDEDAIMKYLKYRASSIGNSLDKNGLVYSLVVEDPRLFKHSNNSNNFELCQPSIIKKGKDFLNEMSNLINEQEVDGTQEDIQEVTPMLEFSAPDTQSLSPIWSTSVRNDTSSSIIPDYTINEVRSCYFTKNNELSLGDETSAIPLILINKHYSYQNKQRPSAIQVTGWDLIIPANWGLAFWIPLIYSGARACGLQELSSCTGIECLKPLFPEDYPDTQAGIVFNANEQVEREHVYMRYPPDKRPNFGKLRIQMPFGIDWNCLLTVDYNGNDRKRVGNTDLPLLSGKKSRINNNSVIHHSCYNGENGFYVLRCLEDLTQLSNFIDALFSKCWRKSRTSDKYDNIYSRYAIDNIITRHDKSLIAVGLEVLSRGNLTSHSTVAIPTNNDLMNIKSSDYSIGPTEPLCPRGITLIEFNKIHIGEYQIPSKNIADIQKKRKQLLKQHSNEQQQVPSLESVYKMEDVHPARKIIGRIQTTVNYRHTSSRYSAIGHCSLRGVIELCRTCYIDNSKVLLGLSRGYNTQYVITLIKVLK